MLRFDIGLDLVEQARQTLRFDRHENNIRRSEYIGIGFGDSRAGRVGKSLPSLGQHVAGDDFRGSGDFRSRKPGRQRSRHSPCADESDSRLCLAHFLYSFSLNCRPTLCFH